MENDLPYPLRIFPRFNKILTLSVQPAVKSSPQAWLDVELEYEILCSIDELYILYRPMISSPSPLLLLIPFSTFFHLSSIVASLLLNQSFDSVHSFFTQNINSISGSRLFDSHTVRLYTSIPRANNILLGISKPITAQGNQLLYFDIYTRGH